MSTTRTDLLTNRLGTNSPAVKNGYFVTARCGWEGGTGTPVISWSQGVSTLSDLSLAQTGVNLTLSHTVFVGTAGSWAKANWSSRNWGYRAETNTQLNTYYIENNTPIDPQNASAIITGIVA